MKNPFKIIEWHTNSRLRLSLTINSKGDDDSNILKNVLHMAVWKYSLWLEIPMIIKPRITFVPMGGCGVFNLTKIGNQLRHGYFSYTRKQYGFTVFEGALHLYYGIQPGSWTRGDPTNSDHVKVVRSPFEFNHVRHTVYDVTGRRSLCDGDTFYKWERECDTMGADKFGKPPMFFDGERLVPVYGVFEYIDPYDGEKIRARVYMCEHEWVRGVRGRWKWLRAILKHLPGCTRIRRSLNIDFEKETGHKKGSWKGGIMGRGFDISTTDTLYGGWLKFCEEMERTGGRD